MTYKTTITNVVTGETTIHEWTAEEIAARETRLASLRKPPSSITRRQCALQLLAANMITAQEALDMTKTAAVPTAIAAVFDAQVTNGAWTPEQRILAEIDFAADNYYRSNSLLGITGLTDEEIDQFFIEAAKL
jgi:hypothetical protein